MATIDTNDTLSLMQAMERMKPSASLLLDTFFPNIPPTSATTMIAVEYRKGHRHLAPFIVNGARGVNIAREGSKIDFYQPPVMAPRRIINSADVEKRGFGESIFSTTTPAERAAAMQARDLREMQDMIVNRKNKMAADILTTGKCEIKGYADDGETVLIDSVDYGFENIITPTTTWDNAGATIYADLKNASELIQEGAGVVPTVAFCGKNIAKYLQDNTQIMKWLSIPSRENLALMSIQPRITAPQVTRIGFIQSLNLGLYSYAETYIDDESDDKKPVPFLDADTVIVGVPGRGKQLHGAITLIGDNNDFQTYAGAYVPYYHANKESQVMSLTVYSRCLLAPEYVDDWAVIKAKG